MTTPSTLARRVRNQRSGSHAARLAALLISAGGLIVQAEESSVVTVAHEPRQKMAYGMDFERLWSWNGLKEQQRLMDVAVRDCKVDYVRVAVNGGAELTEGTFDAGAYKAILEVMACCKTARPDIKFFGSPRPINEAIKGAPWDCYPLWFSGVSCYTNSKGVLKWKKNGPFDAEKAGDYMVRYVRFMKSKGFTISYLDLKNECMQFRPAAMAAMAKRIREQLGKDAPLLIAPSSFDYNEGAAWVKEAMDGPGTSFFDILSTHNTRGTNSGPLAPFVALGAQIGKPVWNTELHGWRGNDTNAVANTAILFDQIRTGVCAISDWLSLGNEKKDYKMFRTMANGSLEVMRIYYIYKQLVNTSGGGYYVPTTVPKGLTSSAAFLRGDLLTVWLLNGTDTPAAGIKVDLGARTIVGGQVKTVWWGPGNGREGASGEAKPAAANALVADVAAQTLICFEVKVK